MEQATKNVTATYKGRRHFKGDRDNMPSVSHYFIDAVSDGQPVADLWLNDIQLLRKAKPEEGGRYEIAFSLDGLVPVSIGRDGELFYKKNSNAIMHRKKDGTEENLSFDPGAQKMGADLRAYNMKLKAEGKQPIKPSRKRW